MPGKALRAAFGISNRILEAVPRNGGLDGFQVFAQQVFPLQLGLLGAGKFREPHQVAIAWKFRQQLLRPGNHLRIFLRADQLLKFFPFLLQAIQLALLFLVALDQLQELLYGHVIGTGPEQAFEHGQGLAELTRSQVGAGLGEFLVHFLFGTVLARSRQQLGNFIFVGKFLLQFGQQGDGLVIALVPEQIFGLLQIPQHPLLGLIGAEGFNEMEDLRIAGVVFPQLGQQG